jgi:glycosyltransferase involved in cell wall biosynthesis
VSINDNPEVTVIIATYNSSGTLYYTLKSLLNQTFQDFEAWIVGDGCTDDSEKIVMSFSDERLHWFNRESNSGKQPAPNNEGIRRAKGKFIAYLGHDDLWMPHHLATLHKTVSEENIDFAYPITVGVTPEKIHYLCSQLTIGLNFEDFQTPPSGWFHKKDLLTRVGCWTENYSALNEGPDKEFFTRVYKSGAAMKAIPSLSVIKFPSPSWRSYEKRTELENAIKTYWANIEANPDRFHIDMLTRIAFEYSKYDDNMILPPGTCLRMMMKYFGYKLIHFYGGNRFPLRQFLHSRHRRIRAKIDKSRGL